MGYIGKWIISALVVFVKNLTIAISALLFFGRISSELLILSQ